MFAMLVAMFLLDAAPAIGGLLFVAIVSTAVAIEARVRYR